MTPDYRPSLVRSFERHLRAENRSEHTIASYLDRSLRQAETFLAGRGRSLLDARREDLEAFLGELLQRRAPETVATRQRGLRVLYRWLEEEEEIPSSPMARIGPPIVPDQPVPVVPEDGLRRLLATCAARTSRRRDTAILMFLSTPAPAGRAGRLHSTTSTSTRTSPSCSARAAASGPALRPQDRRGPRPLPARPPRHKDADLPWLWLASAAA